jgi:tungstate transport system substrate-binding protein
VSLALPLSGVASASPSVSTKVTNVIVQGGTTPTDSGLLQNVIEPMFKAQYPQYNLQYVSVGTGQAITNAENGEADAVFTHSATLEQSFVAGGYSYEPGGRLVMSSDFITVGATSDPAGVLTGPANDVTAAFNEIATAGATGKADFVSRGDQSGTNVKELSIWALVHTEFGLSLNTLGEPGPSGTTSVDSWYHTTGLGQGANLQTTNQCPFSSGACYTIADRGTFNEFVTLGDLPDLELVSQDNSGQNAQGGTTLLANPYHAYAVNPAKEPGVHINLKGALAFLNFLTSAATQRAIGAYPTKSNPAFHPDARPLVTVTQGVPSAISAKKTVTVSGTALPGYYLDPPITGQPVLLQETSNLSNTIASTTVASNGTWSITFSPASTGSYIVFLPENPDFIVGPPYTSFRQSTSAALGSMTVTGSVTLNVASQSGDTVNLTGTAAPTTQRVNAKVKIQGEHSGSTTWQNLASVSLPNGQSSYSTSVLLPSAGTWKLHAKYSDPGVVNTGTSAAVTVTAP